MPKAKTTKRVLAAKDSTGRHQFPLVVIEWLDTYCVHRWRTDEPSTEPLHCRSVGWLMHDGDKTKVIAASVAGELEPGFQRDGEMTIPVGCIVRIQRIR